MQEQFDREEIIEQKEERVEPECVIVTDETQNLPDMQLEEQIKKEEANKKLRFAANRIGWATVILVVVWLALMLGISATAYAVDALNGDVASFTLFYNKYYIIINEVTLALALAVATLMLRSVPKFDIQRENVPVGRLLKILVMCFGAGYVGNRIGTTALSFWNNVTGNSVGDELAAVLSDTSPLLMFISVSVLAPILEELFFRKILAERLRAFGELTAIIIPAYLFALFHQSASQLVYAFFAGVLLGYFYCRTGNYWQTVLIHGVFNTVSGVIPMLYLPKITEFLSELQSLDTGSDAFSDQIISMLGEYGLPLALFALHSIIVFAINITGVVLLVINFKKYEEKKGEYPITFKESSKLVFKTPGVIACTFILAFMTIISLFG